ncbi:hypothetical protein OPHB3_0825 [Oceanobacillus picturae]|uniref:DUF1659 domain-containing protein n=1 Tax=Oceanobacillus picturae TaxID=171693 RepID=A0A0U9H2M1_9BACI|nr:DUF1659 domain-containing protein [Oceanobacillus picturae]GAQ16901.1 hypothetical protein OPHB3_0825 [Oceanobacillus picturae]
MAVAELMNSSLRLVFENGIDEDSGNPSFKTKSFTNVKGSATADQLYSIATAVAALQELPLYNIERNDSSDIIEE